MIPHKLYAISDTGPLISAFQSDSMRIFEQIFSTVFLSPICRREIIEHGWEEDLRSAASYIRILTLTDSEQQQAFSFAEQIARHPNTHSPIAAEHLGEAEAMTLACRKDLRGALLLLDESAARSVATQAGIPFSGFPGALLLAAQKEIISAEEIKIRLEQCREQGTHYSITFIRQIYEKALE